MSFSYLTFQGEAKDFKPALQFSAGHERESAILEVVNNAIGDIVSCVGGHVAVSASGHLNEFDDQPGDNLNVQVTSFLRPDPPVQDAGLEASGGSARNFPPESSTAAPATEDNSPPATQEPIPQPVVVDDGTINHTASKEWNSGADPVVDPAPAEEPAAETPSEPQTVSIPSVVFGDPGPTDESTTSDQNPNPTDGQTA